MLENDSYAYLKDSFERLLIDLDVEVSQCIIKNLGLLYSRFNNEDLMKRVKFIACF